VDGVELDYIWLARDKVGWRAALNLTKAAALHDIAPKGNEAFEV
jgi:hypothetical protein